MTDTPQVLLAHHLKTLKLPTFLREYDQDRRDQHRTIRKLSRGDPRPPWRDGSAAL